MREDIVSAHIEIIWKFVRELHRCNEPMWRYLFDGDNLTIMKLSSRDQIRETRKFNPRLNFMVSHDHGLLHENMLPIKDQSIGLSHFCRC